jgi:glycosyltransferase involved in cell wall biosynthesis
MKLNYVSVINTTGYGTTSLNIMKALMDLGIHLSFFNIGGGIQCYSEEDIEYIKKSMENSDLADFNAPSLQIWLLRKLQMFPGKGYRIGFPIFELDEFTPREKNNASALDLMFVCSQWAKDIVQKETSTPAEVVPLGQNVHKYPELLNIKKTDDVYRFFTCGKWEKRKGHDVLAEAFSKAFTPKDNVELNLMCSNNTHLTKEQEIAWKNKFLLSKMGAKVRFLEPVALQYDVFKRMAYMDCGVFISRAEGWNLELMEAISLNKPVITTNYSAHTEYCNKDNSYLVDIDSFEPAIDDKWFDGSIGKWASLGERQLDQIIEYMRYMYNERPSNESGGKLVREYYTWENTAKRIVPFF